MQRNNQQSTSKRWEDATEDCLLLSHDAKEPCHIPSMLVKPCRAKDKRFSSQEGEELTPVPPEALGLRMKGTEAMKEAEGLE